MGNFWSKIAESKQTANKYQLTSLNYQANEQIVTQVYYFIFFYSSTLRHYFYLTLFHTFSLNRIAIAIPLKWKIQSSLKLFKIRDIAWYNNSII